MLLFCMKRKVHKSCPIKCIKSSLSAMFLVTEYYLIKTCFNPIQPGSSTTQLSSAWPSLGPTKYFLINCVVL